ncbi:MAG: class I SAM-dependent methyltransferase [Planctomycetota bacterium]|jgi:ubiquinone/menaquinone biosynthesis C-methylase UbiE
MRDPTQRFSDRVDNYIKYRPSYPIEIIALLNEKCGLTEKTIIADIGSGTGIFTKLLLDNGNRVLAVEPNKEMRQAAELKLEDYSDFISITASAEKTGLQSNSIDIIISAQAFHWFNREKTRLEFNRIIRPGGKVVLIWNKRQIDCSEFLIQYENLLQKYATDYNEINHANINHEVISEFFGSNSFESTAFKYIQEFDYEGLNGRLLSCSYVPNRDHPNYTPMISELKEIFQKCATNGKVVFEYQTIVYYGQFSVNNKVIS